MSGIYLFCSMLKVLRPLLFCAVTLFSACSQNTLTGKQMLAFIPEAELQSLSISQYDAFLTSHKVLSPQSNKNAAMVKSVGENITRAVRKYYDSMGNAKALLNYQWEYNLVEDPSVNAWCLPGGKIVVYTGILPVTLNENALAVVMGHEVSHALLQHGNQRMSSSMVRELGGLTLSLALTNKPSQTRDIFLNAYGIGSEIGVMLPFSRKQELEADRFGLLWAAMAGYDPYEAINFWNRMSETKNATDQPPVFLSTHPSDQARIEAIKKYLADLKKN